MPTQVHDGQLRPIVNADPTVHAKAMREEVVLVGVGPTGDPVLVAVTAAGEVKVDGAAGGGGGTEYDEGDTDATITGTAILWEDAGDTLRPVSAATPLPVGDGGSTLSVDDGGGEISVDVADGADVALGSTADDENDPTVIGRLVAILLALGGTLDVSVSNTPAVNQGTSPWVVAGNKTPNGAAPGTSNVGTLPAVATAAAPSYTEGNQVALSVDLDGNLRTSGAGGGLTEPVDTESADGAHATLGTTTDAGVTTDTSGTVIGFLRGIVIQLGNILTALAGTINVLHPQPSTATRSSVAASETVVTILAANSSRLGATVFHDGGGARRLWLALGSGAAETDYTVELRGGDYFQIPFNYRGVITGVWNNDGGSNTFARVTELT